MSIETRLSRLEAAAAAGEAVGKVPRPVVVRQLFAADGAAQDAPPLPEGVDMVLIRRRIVEHPGDR